MDLLCFAEFQSGPYCSHCQYDKYPGKGQEQQGLQDAIISSVCELTMEYGNQAKISEDSKIGTFILDAVIGDLNGGITASFMPIQLYSMKVTLDFEDAVRPPKHAMIGKYIMLPITVSLRNTDGKETAPFFKLTYQANVPAIYQYRLALERIGKSYVFHDLRDSLPTARFAATACEGMGMDTD